MNDQMQGNPHFKESAKLLADNPGEYEIELSRSLATLALAFEQRTANLLAFYAMIPRGSTDSDTIALHQDILERLGLK